MSDPLPPRKLLAPSPGIVWDAKLLEIVARINLKEQIPDEDWKYFKIVLKAIDPQAAFRWKNDTLIRRAIGLAIQYLSVDQLQEIIDRKKRGGRKSHDRKENS